MMSLVIDRQVVADPYMHVAEDGPIPDHGPVLVPLALWLTRRSELVEREAPVGVLLRSDEHPEKIADDVSKIQLIALDFPTFRDGRAYSYARLLRERFRFDGELRAVGDVALEQLHYMERVGFNAFEIDSEDPLADFTTADRDFSVWYQPSGDRRLSAAQRRTGVKQPASA